LGLLAADVDGDEDLTGCGIDDGAAAEGADVSDGEGGIATWG